MRTKPPPAWTSTAAARIRAYLGDDARIGLILGTGWNEALEFDDEREMGLDTLCPIFQDLPPLPGHDRKLIYGRLAEVPVLALRGRIHLNEAPIDPVLPDLVRIQTAMLIEAGCRTLIVTSAVGSLRDDIRVGDVVMPHSLITVFAPPMPLYAGEFVSPEDAIDQSALRLIRNKFWRNWRLPFSLHSGTHVMVRGPFFEGRRRDKGLLAHAGADVVGMSLLPELCVTALYPKAAAVPLTFVTNTASEGHSHQENQARARNSAAALGQFIGNVVRTLSGLADLKPGADPDSLGSA